MPGESYASSRGSRLPTTCGIGTYPNAHIAVKAVLAAVTAAFPMKTGWDNVQFAPDVGGAGLHLRALNEPEFSPKKSRSINCICRSADQTEDSSVPAKKTKNMLVCPGNYMCT